MLEKHTKVLRMLSQVVRISPALKARLKRLGAGGALHGPKGPKAK